MNVYKEILELSEKYKEYTAQNLSELIKIKSLSMGEKEVQQELSKQMKDAHFDKVWTDALGNVIGQIGTGKTILAIDAHMDTVDTGNMDNWDFDPFSGEIKDGFIHGRGTVDQKGGAASFITAGRILKELNIGKELTILFVGSVMEEDCDGLCWKHLYEEEGIKPNYAISTEPTNLNIYRGQRGRMEMRVHFHGVSCHGSAPERGDNAIYKAANTALAIEKLNQKLAHDDFLGKGTITISEIKSGSPSLCAVADYAYIHLDRRLTWGETKESAVKQIKELIEGMNARVEVLYYEETAYTGKKYGMEKYYPTWKINEDEQIIKIGTEAFEQTFNKKPLVDKWTFSTNGVTINGFYNIPLLGFGPGNEILAHAPNEKVPISDLVTASAFYASFIHTLNATV